MSPVQVRWLVTSMAERRSFSSSSAFGRSQTGPSCSRSTTCWAATITSYRLITVPALGPDDAPVAHVVLVDVLGRGDAVDVGIHRSPAYRSPPGMRLGRGGRQSA